MRRLIASTLLAGLVLAAVPAQAHTPLFNCYDNGDGTVSCEGGFSDGSSAAGVAVHVLDGSGNTLLDTKLDEFSEVTFDKPEGGYTVQFDAGEGHAIEVPGSEIF
ncbi:MAG: hypothetical protein ACOCVM_08865 [Desulfovibrionaceae bacterium]